jgi:hypothetical protein
LYSFVSGGLILASFVFMNSLKLSPGPDYGLDKEAPI